MPDILIDDAGDTWSVIHTVGPLGPVFFTMQNDDFPKTTPPDHPVFRAIRGLDRDFTYDNSEYRYLCERLGFDPDYNRMPDLKTRDYLTGLILGSDPSSKQIEKKFRGEIAVILDALNIAMHGFDLEKLTYAQSLKIASGLFSDEQLRQFHVDLKSCIDRAVTSEPGKFNAMVDVIANPWQGNDHYWVSVFPPENNDGMVERNSILGQIPEWPLFVRPPKDHDVRGTLLATILEQAGLCVVLSPEEIANYEAGGDAAHWARFHQISDGVQKVDKIERRSNLDMTRALLKRMAANAYEHYQARQSRNDISTTRPLSYKSTSALPPSGELDPKSKNLGALWPAVRYIHSSFDHTITFNHDTNVSYHRQHGFISFRTTYFPVRVGDHSVFFSITFKKYPDGDRYDWYPCLNSDDFSVKSAYDDKLVPFDIFYDILRGLADAADMIVLQEKQQNAFSLRKYAKRFGVGACIFFTVASVLLSFTRPQPQMSSADSVSIPHLVRPIATPPEEK